VSGNGLTGTVTPIAKGKVTITVTTEDGGKKATRAIDVCVPVESVTLNKAQTTISVKGSEYLTAKLNPSGVSNPSYTWTSSDPSIVKVENKNDWQSTITGVAPGTATITFKVVAGRTVTTTCVVTVK
jgi:uncharacterized protein YjdB